MLEVLLIQIKYGLTRSDVKNKTDMLFQKLKCISAATDCCSFHLKCLQGGAKSTMTFTLIESLHLALNHQKAFEDLEHILALECC